MEGIKLQLKLHDFTLEELNDLIKHIKNEKYKIKEKHRKEKEKLEEEKNNKEKIELF